METDKLIKLNIYLNAPTAETLLRIDDIKGISSTEAVRRSIAIYDYLLSEELKGRIICTSKENGRKSRQLMLL